MADPAARGIRSGLAEAGYTLESGGVWVRQALHEGGFDEDDLVRLDARELRQCHTGSATLPGPNDLPMAATLAPWA